MESDVSKEDPGAAPWNKKGQSYLLNVCRIYLEQEFFKGIAFTMSAEEWHALLLDAYRELVSLGVITSPK